MSRNKTSKQFWDQDIEDDNKKDRTVALFALANKQFQIVSWIETQGGVKHKSYNVQTARDEVDGGYNNWID